MSKPMKIRFTYGEGENQEFKSVGSVHKGPINLENLNDLMSNPTYNQISFADTDGPQNVEIVQSQAQMVNVPLTQIVTQAGNRPQEEPSINLQAGNQPIDTNAYKIQSDKQLIKEYQLSSRELIGDKRQSGKREAIFKKQSTEQTPQPGLKVEEVRESQFKRQVMEPANQKKEQVQLKKPQLKKNESNSPDQIVLKAPSFKYNPETQGERGVMKRQYVRGEKTQKYLYSGIPQRKQDDFLGCFGCCAPKPKSYTISNQNEGQ